MIKKVRTIKSRDLMAITNEFYKIFWLNIEIILLKVWNTYRNRLHTSSDTWKIHHSNSISCNNVYTNSKWTITTTYKYHWTYHCKDKNTIKAIIKYRILYSQTHHCPSGWQSEAKEKFLMPQTNQRFIWTSLSMQQREVIWNNGLWGCTKATPTESESTPHTIKMTL